LTDKKIRVLVVEDHHLVRRGLVALLSMEEGFQVVGEAADGGEAVAEHHRCNPDVTLIDLSLPGLSGVEVIRRIRRERSHAIFIVLTTYDGDEDIHQALRAGARAYLLKGVTREELMATLRIVHEGRLHIPPVIAAKLAQRVGTKELTPREADVLRQMAEGNNNKAIAKHLQIGEATVKTHVNRLLSKLKVMDRTQAVTTAVRRGFVPFEALRSPSRR
jgi:DNA-binding NarL/FixJ family response regulator